MERTFKEHITELRNLLFIDFSIFTILFFICFAFSQKILTWAITYYGVTAYSFAPFEYLTGQMKVAVIFALLLSLPILLYSVYLYCKEFVTIKKVLAWIGVVYILGVLGFTLGATYFSKAILQSMVDYTPIATQWSLSSIVTIVGSTALLMAITLQLLLIIPFLKKLHILDYSQYITKRKMLMFILFIAIAIITPDPTMFSTSVLFTPVALSLEGGFQISRLVTAR
jgi:sec-independent protein translocase protein TatC